MPMENRPSMRHRMLMWRSHRNYHGGEVALVQIWHSRNQISYHKRVYTLAMTRPRDIKAAEREAQLQEAIAAVRNKEHTCHSAAIAFNVRRRTLYHRVKGNKKPRDHAHEQAPNLTHVDEKELVRWIGLLTRSGYPPRYSTLQRLAEIIRERRVKETGEVQTRVYDKIGEQWVRRFLACHPELASVRPRSIDAARVKDCAPERL
jgi:hypothetical protein